MCCRALIPQIARNSVTTSTLRRKMVSLSGEAGLTFNIYWPKFPKMNAWFSPRVHRQRKALDEPTSGLSATRKVARPVNTSAFIGTDPTKCPQFPSRP
jgi:hypothetical protein